jgi:hypothetical protein
MPEPPVPPARRTPTAHAAHTKPCGCASPEAAFTTCPCGACYDATVLSFHAFRCYDCGRVRSSNPHPRPKGAPDGLPKM